MPLALPGRAQVGVPAAERPQKTPQVSAHTCGVSGESPPILRESFAFFSRARVPPQCGSQLSSRRRGGD